MKISLITILILSASCSSAREKEWYINDVAKEKRRWRYCDKSKDGEEFHHKGICYISRRCYKKWTGKEKCERLPMICKWGDIECLKQNNWPSIRKM